MKRTDAEKISSVQFSTGEVLVANAGNAGNSARAIELLAQMAKDKPIDDYRAPADLARFAMTQLKQELRQQYGNCSASEFQDLIWKEELQSELLLGYYYDNKPYLFKIDLAVGRSDKEASWYAALGSGSNLGSYLLSEHTAPDMSSGLVISIASHVLETVCKHDAYCSLPAKVGLIVNDIITFAKANDSLPNTIHPTAYGRGMVLIASQNMAATWAKKLGKIIESERLKRNRRIMRLLASERSQGAKDMEDFLSNPTEKTLKKLQKRFSGLSHITFTHNSLIAANAPDPKSCTSRATNNCNGITSGFSGKAIGQPI
jgi:20S proteasome alpha/beta subunit